MIESPKDEVPRPAGRKLLVVCLTWLALGAVLLVSRQVEANNLGSALVPVTGSTSRVQLSDRRDADVTLSPRSGGELLARMDSMRDRNTGETLEAPGNRLELEISVNGGPSSMTAVPFDISGGLFLARVNLGLSPGDSVQLKRLDFYDSDGIRFATLGVRVFSGP